MKMRGRKREREGGVEMGEDIKMVRKEEGKEKEEKEEKGRKEGKQKER